MRIASDSPENHPKITENEKTYITCSINFQTNYNSDVIIPWKQLFKSFPFFAIIIAETTINVVEYALMTCLSLYLANVLNLNVNENGLYNSLPWLLTFLAILTTSRLTDFLLSRKYVTTTFIRKLNQLIASFGSAIFLVLAGYVDCNATLVIISVSAAMFFYGFRYPGAYCNIQDIAPYFAGITFGITNTIGSTAGILAPEIVGRITDSNVHSQELWLYSFYVIGIISALGGILFMFLASGEVHSWGNPKFSETIQNGSSNSEN